MTAEAIGRESVVRFHQLQIRPSEDDPGQAVVGRLEVGEFIELPAAFADAIPILQSGASLAEAEHRIRAQHGVEVDLTELIEALEDVGFVAELDGRPIPDPHHAAVNHLPWLTAAHARWLFGTPAKLVYAALVTATLVTVVLQPDVLPTYRDFFWSDYVGLTVLVNTIMFSLAATAHELSHLAAARSLGAPGRIRFATRLHHLVLETDVTAIWSVPRRYRYRVYLSGMLCDIAVICTATLLIAHASLPLLADRLLAALVVVLVASMALQAQLYMRTDLYFVLMDVLRCRNLFHDGLAYTRHLLRRLGHAIVPARFTVTDDPAADLPAHERRAVRIYAAAVLVGSTVALGSFALYGLPILVTGVAIALSAIIDGAKGGNLIAAVDATLVVLVEGTLQAMFLVTFYRRHGQRLRWRRRTNPAVGEGQ